MGPPAVLEEMLNGCGDDMHQSERLWTQGVEAVASPLVPDDGAPMAWSQRPH